MALSYIQGDEPVPGSGYRLVEFLGKGAFGEVWKATAPGGAEAALKIIRLGGKEGRKEFRALQLVKRIRHPNLVPIIAFWLKTADGSILDDALADGQELPPSETASAGPLKETMQALPKVSSILATELIIAMGLGDRSLFDRLKECREQGLEGIPREELLHYMTKAAEAIDFLNSPVHDLGSGPVAIQHCDIKPQNLLIVGGATQVCDFGLARMLGAERSTTAAATIAYAAPEYVAEGKPSASTDQYSLAVSYYELGTGRLPYGDQTLAAVMDAKRRGKLDFSQLSPAEQAVFRRGCAQDPDDRYPTALEMVQAVSRAPAGDAATVPLTRPAPEKPARRPLRTFATLLVLLALVGLGAYVAAVESGRLKGWLPWRARGALPTDPADAAFAKAEQRARQGESALAVDDYTEAIRLNPQYWKAYLGRGRCYWKLAEYDEAIEDLEKLNPEEYDVRPELAGAYFQRGSSCLRDEDLAGALADFEEAMRLDQGGTAGYNSRQEYADAYLARAKTCLDQHEFDQAIEDLNRARTHNNLDKARALMFSRLGAAYRGKKMWQEAVDNLTLALQIQENDLDYLARALTYLQMDETEMANADFDAAIRMNPENTAARCWRGYTCVVAEDPPAEDVRTAIAHFTKVIRSYPNIEKPTFPLVDLHVFRAACYVKAQDLPRAGDDLAEAIRLPGPKDRQSILQWVDALAVAYAEAGQFPEAVKWAEQAVELAPDEATKQEYQSQLERYQAGQR